MSKKKVTIIDLDIGNIFSLQSALKFCGAETHITSKISEIEDSNNIILPGDGSFPYCMKKIREKKLFNFLKNINKTKKNFLGVCVGMQLLFQRSFEHGETEGLSIFKGNVKKIPNYDDNKIKIEIPNIGWCPLIIKKSNKENFLLNKIENFSNVYFIHSYRVELENYKIESAFTEYYGNKITSVIQEKNISACQFHPEKSGEVGIKILKNFLKIV